MIGGDIRLSSAENPRPGAIEKSTSRRCHDSHRECIALSRISHRRARSSERAADDIIGIGRPVMQESAIGARKLLAERRPFQGPAARAPRRARINSSIRIISGAPITLLVSAAAARAGLFHDVDSSTYSNHANASMELFAYPIYIAPRNNTPRL